ncbi:hypothetical protein Zmor_022370 [Zophobas morio]|uniref:Uncharacterized protein n=1 Tax=Zophobas morio TaxID=2755281 RepID=A0AA38HW64_9CUCU|nr:hypothetical protein Zmor_022370 [Zophobas morio]
MAVRGAGPGESAIFTVPLRKTESRIVSGLPDLIRAKKTTNLAPNFIIIAFRKFLAKICTVPNFPNSCIFSARAYPTLRKSRLPTTQSIPPPSSNLLSIPRQIEGFPKYPMKPVHKTSAIQ